MAYQRALNDGILFLALVGDLCDDDRLSGAHDVDRKVHPDLKRTEAFLGANVVDVVQPLALEPVQKDC